LLKRFDKAKKRSGKKSALLGRRRQKNHCFKKVNFVIRKLFKIDKNTYHNIDPATLDFTTTTTA
jgi:hypothetical protein